MSDTTENLLEERGKIYGDAVLNYARVAEVWSGILNVQVTAYQVSLCMVGLKLVRADISPDHEDSVADALGYARIAQLIQEAVRT